MHGSLTCQSSLRQPGWLLASAGDYVEAVGWAEHCIDDGMTISRNRSHVPVLFAGLLFIFSKALSIFFYRLEQSPQHQSVRGVLRIGGEPFHDETPIGPEIPAAGCLS